MAVRKIGSRLVMEGADSYISAANRASEAERQVGRAAEEAAAGMSQMTMKGQAVAVTLGTLVAGAVQKVGSTIMGMGQQALSVVGAYEALAMSMTSLMAKEVKAQTGVEDMTEALELAAPAAEDLLAWIQQLAIKSPFDQQGVAQAFKTAMAYGFTSEQAKRLTAATIDFSTATGDSGYAMQMISLALGQMRARGKVAGQELMQLTNAGVSSTAILTKMGYTIDDVSAGLVSADAFFEEFVKTMGDDFGGAAERSSNTINGLLNSLADIKAMGLRAVFQPIFTAALPSLAAFTGKIQELIPYMEIVGTKLGEFTAALIANKAVIGQALMTLGAFVGGFLLVTQVIPAVIGLVSALAAGIGTVLAGGLFTVIAPITLVGIALGTLAAAVAGIGFSIKKFRDQEATQLAASTQTLADNMEQRALITAIGEEKRLATQSEFADKILQRQAQQGQEQGESARSWGENLVVQFAQGMANAISAVLSVLTEIGNAIAFWLQPGSPPNILPDLPEWGESAMQEWLNGFTNADMGMINGMSQTLEGLIRSLDLPPLEMEYAVGDMRRAVMAAVDQINSTGSISSDLMSTLVGLTGEATSGEGGQIGGNPAAVEAYIQALVRSQAAQATLNEITERYRGILEPLYGELKEIGKERQAFIDNQRKEQLQQIVRDARARGDDDAVRLAEMELREMALREQIATTEEAAAVEAEAAQEEVNAAGEAMALAQAQMDLQRQANELVQRQIELLEQQAEAAEAAAEAGGGAAAGGGAGGLAEQLAAAVAGAGGGAGGLSTAMEGFKARLTSLVEDIKAPFANIGAQVTAMGAAWDTAWTLATGRVDTFMQDLWAKLGPGGEYPGIMASAQGIMEQQWGEGGTWAGNIELVKTAIASVQEKLAWLAPAVDVYFKLMAASVGLFVGFYQGMVAGIAAAAEPFLTAMGFVVNGTITLFTGLYDFIAGIVGIIVGMWQENNTKVETSWQQMSDGIKGIVLGLTEMVMGSILGTLAVIEAFVSGFVNKVVDYFTNLYMELVGGSIVPDMVNGILGWFTTLVDGAVGKAMEVYEGVKGKFQDLISWLTDQRSVLVNIGVNLMNGLRDGILDAAIGVIASIMGVAQSIIDGVRGLLDEHSPSRVFMDIGRNVGVGMAMGIESSAGLVGSAAQGMAARPIATVASPSQMSRQTTIINNNQRIQGIGQVSAANGANLAQIEQIVRRVMADAMDGRRG